MRNPLRSTHADGDACQPHACSTVPVDPPAVFTGEGAVNGYRAGDFSAMDAPPAACDNRLAWPVLEFPHFGRWARSAGDLTTRVV